MEKIVVNKKYFDFVSEASEDQTIIDSFLFIQQKLRSRAEESFDTIRERQAAVRLVFKVFIKKYW